MILYWIFFNDIHTPLYYNLSIQHKQARPSLTHQATLLVQIHTLASLIKFKLENSESQFHLQGKARVQPALATLAVNGHGFTVKFLWLDSHLNILQPALSSQAPLHTPGHIIDWDPNLSYIDQNLVCELKISMSPTRQGQELASSTHPGC
jgi:hypothetical protein